MKIVRGPFQVIISKKLRDAFEELSIIFPTEHLYVNENGLYEVSDKVTDMEKLWECRNSALRANGELKMYVSGYEQCLRHEHEKRMKKLNKELREKEV